jgi:ATP-dependent DNA helicase RecG
LAEGLVDGLVESQKEILKLVLNNPKISKREMSEKIGISSTAVDKNINFLKKKGLLKRVGSAKSGHWEIVEK